MNSRFVSRRIRTSILRTINIFKTILIRSHNSSLFFHFAGKRETYFIPNRISRFKVFFFFCKRCKRALHTQSNNIHVYLTVPVVLRFIRIRVSSPGVVRCVRLKRILCIRSFVCIRTSESYGRRCIIIIASFAIVCVRV